MRERGSGSGAWASCDQHMVEAAARTLGLEFQQIKDGSLVKQAHHRLCLTHHPDKGGDPEKFKEISKAYELLLEFLGKERCFVQCCTGVPEQKHGGACPVHWKLLRKVRILFSEQSELLGGQTVSKEAVVQLMVENPSLKPLQALKKHLGSGSGTLPPFLQPFAAWQMDIIEKLPDPEAIRTDRTARSPFPVTFEPGDYAPDGPQRASTHFPPKSGKSGIWIPAPSSC